MNNAKGVVELSAIYLGGGVGDGNLPVQTRMLRLSSPNFVSEILASLYFNAGVPSFSTCLLIRMQEQKAAL